MNSKIAARISNIVFALAIGTAAYVLISLYLVRKNLPPGVCPVENSQPLIYTAIGLSLLSLALSFWSDRIKKREEKDK